MENNLIDGKRIYQLTLQTDLVSSLKIAVDNEGFSEAKHITLGQLLATVSHPALSLGTPNGLSLIPATQILSLNLATINSPGALNTLPNDETLFLNGLGGWAVPAGGGGGVTPTDNILKWDTNKYVAYPAILETHPGIPYFYIEDGSGIPLGGYSMLGLDASLTLPQLFARSTASFNNVWAEGLLIDYSGTKSTIKGTLTRLEISGWKTISYTPRVDNSIPILIGDTVTTNGRVAEYVLVDTHNTLFNINMTTVRLNKGTVNKFLYLDSNKNITYVDAPGGGDYILPISTASVLGGVKIGSGVSVSVDGTISVSTDYEPIITASTSAYYLNGLKEWTLFPTILTLSALSATIPLRYNNTTGVFTIDQANTSTHGYLSSTDWNTFNNKVSFPGFGTSHSTAAYGDHTHSQYITGNYVTSFNTRSGSVALSKTDVEDVLTGVITSHTHSFAGGITSIGLSVPTGFTVSNSPLTSNGTLGITFTNGYSLPTIASQTNWDTAYSWGNHTGLYDNYGYWTLTAGGSTNSVNGVNGTYTGISFISGTNVSISKTLSGGIAQITINATSTASGLTSVGISLPSDVFTVSNSPLMSNGTITSTFKSQIGKYVFAAPISSGTPAFRALTIDYLPTGTTSTTVALGNHTHTGVYDNFEYFTFGVGSSRVNIYGKNAGVGQYKGIGLIAGNNITIEGTSSVDGLSMLTINATNSVSSIGLSLPSIFNVTNSPVTGSGTLTAILVSQTAGKVFAAPATTNGVPSFQSLTINHLPTGTSSTTVALGNHTHSQYQPLNSDLTAIAALTATGGFAYRNGTGSWSIQTVSGGNGFQLQYPGGTFDVLDGGWLNITVPDAYSNIVISAVPSSKRINISSPNSVQSTDITKVKTMAVMTQAAYTALTTKVATTLYIIVD